MQQINELDAIIENSEQLHSDAELNFNISVFYQKKGSLLWGPILKVKQKDQALTAALNYAQKAVNLMEREITEYKRKKDISAEQSQLMQRQLWKYKKHRVEIETADARRLFINEDDKIKVAVGAHDLKKVKRAA